MKLSELLDAIKPPKIRRWSGHNFTTLSKTTVPVLPREYLDDLTPWPGIIDDIKGLLDPHTNHESDGYRDLAAAFKFSANKRTACDDHKSLIRLAAYVYEDPTVGILEDLFSVKCDFGDRQCAFNIGDPDRVFYTLAEDEVNDIRKTRFIVQWKTPWNFPTPVDIREHFRNERGNPQDTVVQAISQLYGYMTFNSLIYGAICNYEALYLFRRTGDTNLQVSPRFLYTDRGTQSPVAALTYICNCVVEAEYHYSSNSLVKREPRGTHVFSLEDVEVDGTWDEDIKVPWTNMDLRLSGAIAKAIATVMTGEVIARPGINFRYQKQAVFKVYDITQTSNLEVADAEIKAYNDLKLLQGKCIPRLYAAGTTTWGWLKFLVIEDCGQIASEKNIDLNFWPRAREAIMELHKSGTIHGDVSLEIFAISNGDVKFIDLGACHQGSPAEQVAELAEFDRFNKAWDAERENNVESWG
ncbi:hypothetical protein AOL_s00188g311 [Orbilia oligospora ATCC 24927]|uniref:Protein kinase domain-containing protein n=2 Tax=Orbilia oligospora TaxID=2813651 RepID=G1XQU9_ARTOA|nr:hypothetical protein AOL_s00188g311 [Orbilia oligospora ATCC 24927]EGX44643.1 hypothetical protein AOL_s00188g311 [Orbilia oligospora ATCC 24927]